MTRPAALDRRPSSAITWAPRRVPSAWSSSALVADAPSNLLQGRWNSCGKGVRPSGFQIEERRK
jgi:hypothetical protein